MNNDMEPWKCRQLFSQILRHRRVNTTRNWDSKGAWCSNNINEAVQPFHNTKSKPISRGSGTKNEPLQETRASYKTVATLQISGTSFVISKVINLCSQTILTKLALFFGRKKLLITLFWAIKVGKQNL